MILITALVWAILRGMKKKEEEKEFTVLFLRETPRALSRKIKAAAALEGKSMRVYVLDLLQDHVTELEKKGQLPKGKTPV